VFVGVVVALLLALIVAGAFLSTELIDVSSLEPGEERETWVLSGTVLSLVIVFGALLTYVLRRFMAAETPRKDPPVAA
jgi:flagellar biogenesis protein FliO